MGDYLRKKEKRSISVSKVIQRCAMPAETSAGSSSLSERAVARCIVESETNPSPSDGWMSGLGTNTKQDLAIVIIETDDGLSGFVHRAGDACGGSATGSGMAAASDGH